MNSYIEDEAGVDVSAVRAAVITNSPAPYRDQLYRRMVEHFASVRVYYTEPASSDRNWPIDEGCPVERLSAIVRLGAAGSLQPGIVRAVRKADVVYVGGYEKVTYVMAMLLGRLMRRRVVLFFDGIAPSRVSRRGLRYRLKRCIVQLPQLCLVNGEVGREYFEGALGVPGDRLRNQYLVPTAAEANGEQVDPVDVLFVGRLIERKGVEVLLDAMRQAPEFSVDIVGEGPDRTRLEGAAHGLRVRFLGEAGRGGVDTRMRAARCLVVPSQDEPWGLVVHEAIQCNLPVVVTDDVGAGRDLVVDGANGCVVSAGDSTELLAGIRRAMSLDRRRLANTNAALLKTWSITSYVSAFVLAASPREI